MKELVVKLSLAAKEQILAVLLLSGQARIVNGMVEELPPLDRALLRLRKERV